MQFVEENQINNQEEDETGKKFPDLLSSKLLLSEEKYDYSYRKPGAGEIHKRQEKAKINIHEEKMDNESCSLDNSECDQNDFDEENPGDSDNGNLDDEKISIEIEKPLENSILYDNKKREENFLEQASKQQNIFSYYKKLESEQQQLEKARVLMPEYMEDINEVVEEEDDEEDEDELLKKNEAKTKKNISSKTQNWMPKNLERSEADYDEQVDEYEKGNDEEESEEQEEEQDMSRVDSEDYDQKKYEQDDEQEDDYDDDDENDRQNNSNNSLMLGKGRHLKYEDVEIPSYLKNIAQNNNRVGHMHHKSESREVVRISLSNPDSDGSISNGEEIDENKNLLFKRPKDCKDNGMEFLSIMNNIGT